MAGADVSSTDSAPRCGTLAVALRDQPSSGATRTLPPFCTGSASSVRSVRARRTVSSVKTSPMA